MFPELWKTDNKKKIILKRGSIKQEWWRQLHTYKSKSRHAIVSIPLINNGQKKGNWINTSETSDTGVFHHSVDTPGGGRGGKGGYSAFTIQKREEKIKLQNAMTATRPPSGSFKCNATAAACRNT